MEVYFMKKIAIVCDSSISLTPAEIEKMGVYVAPLTIIHNGNEYLDQITITTEGVNERLRDNQVLTTSQPNLGYMINLFEEIKEKGYDHIFCLPITRHLSGTHRTFVQAMDEVGFDNMTIVDTLTLVSPIQRMINVILESNEANESIDTINEKLQKIVDNTESFVLPKDLKQLKLSGRISPAAATMASLLRIKPILKLDNKGETIDKFDTARTESKAFDIMLDDLAKHNVSPETHYLDFLHCEGEDIIANLIEKAEDRFGKFYKHISILPSSLATHAGIGTIVMQWTLKN